MKNVSEIAAGERDLLSEAQVVLVDNLQEHGVSTSVSIEVEQDADGNVVVPIIIDDDDETAAGEAGLLHGDRLGVCNRAVAE